MADPKVSVVLAVFNGDRYLESSVRSVQEQTFADFELIVVDDGSTDETPAILARIRQTDSRIAILRTPNRGLAAALNHGFAAARGSYVARQDADDLSLPGRFERLAAHLDLHPSVGAVGTSAEVIDRSNAVIGQLAAPVGPRAVRHGLGTLRATPVHGSMMLRKDAFTASGGYREAFRLSQDYDLWLRMAARYDVDNVPDVLYRWRMLPESGRGERRATQLKYSGIALVFDRERRRYGQDSYALLERHARDLDAFAAQYRLGAAVHAQWAELLLRGLGNSAAVRRHIRSAIVGGHFWPWTLCLLGWTHLGLPWPGGKPLSAPETTGIDSQAGHA